MIAQKLLAQDLAVAAVAIDAAQIKGVLLTGQGGESIITISSVNATLTRLAASR